MILSDINPQKGAKTLVRDLLLKQRFTTLWRRCLSSGADDNADAAWKALERGYSEPHRHYHDEQHLAHCLEQLDLAADEVQKPDQVEMAIWFHDVIHDPGQQHNEQRSADSFRDLASGVMDQDFIEAVDDLVMVTTHTRLPDDLDHQFICDIDLASFGCPWECFLRDSDAVKAEFLGPDEDYYRGKVSFLEAMLQRPKIFFTDFFNVRYEEQARENIRRLLEAIEQKGA